MTDSVDLKKAREAAEEIDKTLLATESGFNHWVHIGMEDGSTFLLANSFKVEWNEWWFVFAEHYDTLVLAKDDVGHIIEFERCPTKTK